MKREQKEQHTIFTPKNLSILLLLKSIVYKNHKCIHYCQQLTKQWKTICDATLKTILNPTVLNGECLTKISSKSFHIFIYLVMAETIQTPSSTDLEEINTEDELTTDTNTWTNQERKKLQFMTEFHEEYQRVFGSRASLRTIIRKQISHMNPPIPSSVC